LSSTILSLKTTAFKLAFKLTELKFGSYTKKVNKRTKES
jgi:hypothetical protein